MFAVEFDRCCEYIGSAFKRRNFTSREAIDES